MCDGSMGSELVLRDLSRFCEICGGSVRSTLDLREISDASAWSELVLHNLDGSVWSELVLHDFDDGIKLDDLENPHNRRFLQIELIP